MKRKAGRKAGPAAEGARPRAMCDEGTRALMDAVVIQAAKDYLYALAGRPDRRTARIRRTELERFFRSGWFRQLSGLDGERLMEKIRKEMNRT